MTDRRINAWVDPFLPKVDARHVHCTSCGQALATIAEGGQLPDRHYPQPTKTRHRNNAHIGINSCGGPGHRDLCPIDRDELTSLIYRAQRDAAGLGAPRLHGVTPAPSPEPRRPRHTPPETSTIDEMLMGLRARKTGAA